MSVLKGELGSVQHGMAMAVFALILGGLWAAYLATHHEQLHGAFETQEAEQQQASMNQHMPDMDMDGISLEQAHASAMQESHPHPSGHEHGAGVMPDHHAGGQVAKAVHTHSGSLAMDAMQRLLRGHIHFMGIGVLVIAVLILVSATTLKRGWKKLFGWTFGLGALLYPPAWILMGFRTVELGPQAAEASVLWLFGPAVGLIIGSLLALFSVMFIACTGLSRTVLFSRFFEPE